jgi:hypothetical protein
MGFLPTYSRTQCTGVGFASSWLYAIYGLFSLTFEGQESRDLTENLMRPIAEHIAALDKDWHAKYDAIEVFQPPGMFDLQGK